MPGPEGAPVQQCTGATRLKVLVLAQHDHQMPLIPYQGPVQQLAPAFTSTGVVYGVADPGVTGLP
jgi:hypothetical protein